MLAFYKEPEKWVTGSYIKIGYFGKSDSDLVYQDEVHGPLIEQVDKTVDLVYTKYMKEKEHQSIEWKESWQDEYLKWICGYANA